MKISVYPLLITTVLVISALVIGLRGTSPQITAYQVSGLQTATSIQGVGLGPMLWSDSFTGTAWQLSPSNTTETSFVQNNALNLNITFTGLSSVQAVTVSCCINLSLVQDPFVVTELDVSTGVH